MEPINSIADLFAAGGHNTISSVIAGRSGEVTSGGDAFQAVSHSLAARYGDSLNLSGADIATAIDIVGQSRIAGRRLFDAGRLVNTVPPEVTDPRLASGRYAYRVLVQVDVGGTGRAATERITTAITVYSDRLLSLAELETLTGEVVRSVNRDVNYVASLHITAQRGGISRSRIIDVLNIYRGS